MRLLGDLDLAEKSMQEAFAAALESWTLAGIPDKPRPWPISTARFKAIDALRRRGRGKTHGAVDREHEELDHPIRRRSRDVRGKNTDADDRP